MSFNKILFAALLTGTSTAFAADQAAGGLDGFVAAEAGKANTTTDWYDTKSSVYDVSASLAYTDSSNFGGQLDYVNFQQDFGTPFYFKIAARDVGAHVYYRSEGWLLGGMVQGRKYNDEWAPKESFTALEGQLYFDNLVLNGQLGTQKLEYTTTENKGSFYAAGINYFVENNLRISAKLEGLNMDDQNYKLDQTNFGVGIEYRLESSPVSVFANYLHHNEKSGSTWNLDNNLFMVGAKFSFGKESLYESMRRGAGLSTAPRSQTFMGVS